MTSQPEAAATPELAKKFARMAARQIASEAQTQTGVTLPVHPAASPSPSADEPSAG